LLSGGVGAAPTWGSCGSGTLSNGTDTDSTLRWSGSAWVENTAVEITTTGDIKLEGQGDTQWYDSDSTNYVAFQSPAAVTSNVTWTLPSADGTSGQLLSTNGTGTLSWTSNLPTSSSVITYKNALEQASTGTLQNDDDLFFSIGAGETWTATWVMSLNFAGARDVIFAVNAPAGATCNMSVGTYRNGTSSVSNVACNTSSGQIPTSGSNEPMVITATVTNGGTPGTVYLQWAQFSAGTASTVYAQSSLQAFRINQTPPP
jgi:hypothetical protein